MLLRDFAVRPIQYQIMEKTRSSSVIASNLTCLHMEFDLVMKLQREKPKKLNLMSVDDLVKYWKEDGTDETCIYQL